MRFDKLSISEQLNTKICVHSFVKLLLPPIKSIFIFAKFVEKREKRENKLTTNRDNNLVYSRGKKSSTQVSTCQYCYHLLVLSTEISILKN